MSTMKKLTQTMKRSQYASKMFSVTYGATQRRAFHPLGRRVFTYVLHDRIDVVPINDKRVEMCRKWCQAYRKDKISVVDEIQQDLDQLTEKLYQAWTPPSSTENGGGRRQ